MENHSNNTGVTGRGSRLRVSAFRNLLNQAEDIHESNAVGLDTITTTNAILTEVNSLADQCSIEERVRSPDEVLLDSFVLSTISDVLVKCTNAVAISTTYEPLEFARKIKEKIRSGDEVRQLDFLKLLGDARDILPNVIEYKFLYGACDFTSPPTPKVKKQLVKEIQEKLVKKELINVKETQSQEEDENNDSVLFLFKVLEEEYKKNDRRPLKYYDFVMDSESFATTVENIFYFSFLIRDGKASLEMDKDEPIIRPISKKELKAARDNHKDNTQIITSIDMQMWNRLKSCKGLIENHRRSVLMK